MVGLKSLLVVNVSNSEMVFSRLHQSYENSAEAAVVKCIYDIIFGARFDGVLPEEAMNVGDVCILTPYNRHKDRLRMMLCDVDEDALDSYAGQTYQKNTNAYASPQKTTTSDSRHLHCPRLFGACHFKAHNPKSHKLSTGHKTK